MENTQKVSKREEFLIFVEKVKAKYAKTILNGESPNVLLKTDYNIIDLECKTFKQWKDEGFKVKKGESGFKIFGRKRKVDLYEKDKKEEEKPKGSYDYYPMAVIFTENQVEKIEEKA